MSHRKALLEQEQAVRIAVLEKDLAGLQNVMHATNVMIQAMIDVAGNEKEVIAQVQEIFKKRYSADLNSMKSAAPLKDIIRS